MSFKQVANHVIDMFDRKFAGMQALLLNHAGRMEGEARTIAPWKDRTGTARRSLHGGVEVKRLNKTFVLYLAHGVKYGSSLEKGTPKHVIRAKKKTLAVPVGAWKGTINPYESKSLPKLSKDGRFVILGKKVNHPGTKAYPAIKPTVENNIPVIRRTVRDYWRSYP